MIVVCPYCKKKIETNPGVLWVKCTECKGKINLSSLGTTPKPKDMPIEQDLAGMDFGKYHLEELIGIGGMGVVYRATDGEGKTVAVKILYYSTEDDENIRKRFDRETEILEGLDHRSIVKLIDKGRHENYMYIVMEYVPSNLAARLKESELSTDEIRKLIADVTDALSYAHDRKIIHRDLKPTNILLTGEGAKISDFGIARVEYEKDKTSLTQTAAILGTFNYMSPEQRLGEKDIDRRADIYSLGVLLYELLTGRVPIGNFPKASQVRKDIPKKIDTVIEKALSQDRRSRYEDVKAFGAECMSALSENGKRTYRLVATVLVFFLIGAVVYIGLFRPGLFQNEGSVDMQADLVAPQVAMETMDQVNVKAPEKARAETPDNNQPQLPTANADDAGKAKAIQPAKPEPKGKKDKKGVAVDTAEEEGKAAGKGQGYLVASTKPPAGVWIDGKPTGRTTPVTFKNPIILSQGSYKVTFTLPTGETYNYTVKIKTGQTTKVIKDFKKTSDSKKSSKDTFNPYSDNKETNGKTNSYKK